MVRKIFAEAVQEHFYAKQGTANKKKIGTSFYRGENCNFNPTKVDFRHENFIEEYLLKGWMPDAPVIDETTRITAFGSCFASNISNHLSSIGYSLSKDRDPDIYISRMGEGLVNTYALLQQFQWCLDNTPPPENLWHGFRAEEFGYDERVKERTRQIFLSTDFFIITLGLSEIWYDEVTGGVFWRAVPMTNYDESRHKFRVASVEESRACLQSMYEIIGRHIPNAKVLFTLSPVSLAATFRPVGCISANSVSKAVLRAALDEFLRQNAADLGNRLYYFPSYEVVMDLFINRFIHDNRHPYDYIVETIMKIFEAVYCKTDYDIKAANTKLKEARARNVADLGLQSA